MSDPTDRLRKDFDDTLAALGGAPPVARESIGQRRTGRRVRLPARRGVLRVIERNGVLYLEDAAEGLRPGASRRRRGRAFGLGGSVVHEVPFERLEQEQVGATLQALDQRLTPKQGLRELGLDGALTACGKPKAKGRVLLIVHGTFSNTENVLAGLRRSEEGKALLGRAVSDVYDQVLAFDHPTLSASPMLNARELARCFEGCQADVDVLCHSRGGLVTRWWIEALDRTAGGARRAVFVGCPLAGTGLASPPNLRATLSLFANVGRALEAGAKVAAVANPFFTIASGLFKVFSSITSLTARTPAVDAAIACVPGLQAMSRVSNNLGLQSLRANPAPKAEYFAVKANFESEGVGWRFWKVFRDAAGRLTDAAADAVFDGENDLVVDTPSMDDFGSGLKLPRASVWDFKTTDRVHHTNYFEQKETVDFIAAKLGI